MFYYIPVEDEQIGELHDKKEMEEMEKEFHETMKSIQAIKDCKKLMGSLQDYILTLLTTDNVTEEDEEGADDGATGGHTDTLSVTEKEKLRTSKEDATQRYAMFRDALAEGAKETFTYDMKSIDDEIARIKKDMEEMQEGFKLFDEQENLLVEKINEKDFQ